MDETLDELLSMLPQQETYLEGLQRFSAEHRRLERIFGSGAPDGSQVFSLLSIRILPDMDFRSMRILPSGMWKNCAETKSIWFVFKMLSI